MVVFICAFCGKVFNRCKAAVKDPKRAYCSYLHFVLHDAQLCDDAFDKDLRYRIGGKDPKAVLRKGLLKAIELGKIRGEVSIRKIIEFKTREHVKEDQ